MTRILHILGRLNRGGVETWLLHVLRNIDRSKYQMDFVVHSAEPSAYDEEVRALGSKILPCPFSRHPFQYQRQLRRILRENGPYDVLHSHVHRYSGFPLAIARLSGVPRRVAHGHNDLRGVVGESLVRRSYYRVAEWLIDANATHGLACSVAAAESLFGPLWEKDGRWRVLYYGMDFEAFRFPVQRDATRARFGIPPDAFVLTHIGRLDAQKNHRFLLEVMGEVIRRESKAYLLLVGDGPLRNEIEHQATFLGLQERVILAGTRDDVPHILKGATDVFVFPSKHEGLGLVLVEAQAAGVPCVASDVIPSEAVVIPALVKKLSLECSPSIWAHHVLSASPPGNDGEDARLEAVALGRFDIRSCVRSLGSIYGE